MDRGSYIERWKQMRARTHAMLEAASLELRDRHAAEDVRSISEIAAHVVACQATVLTGLASDDFPWKADNERYGAMSMEAMMESSRDLDALLVQMVQTAEDGWLAGTPSKYSLTREAWLWETLEHEIHHVGQIATLIRLGGGEPARIFG